MNSQQRRKMDKVTELANLAFWDVVAKAYASTAKSGDLSPGMTFEFDRITRAAIEEWISNNVPEQPEHLTVQQYEEWWGAEADSEGDPPIAGKWYVLGEFEDYEAIVSGGFDDRYQAINWMIEHYPAPHSED